MIGIKLGGGARVIELLLSNVIEIFSGGGGI